MPQMLQPEMILRKSIILGKLILAAPLWYSAMGSWSMFVSLRFYGPVSTIEVMLSQSVNLLKVFLGRTVNQYTF